jgi:hypothetical protein
MRSCSANVMVGSLTPAFYESPWTSSTIFLPQSKPCMADVDTFEQCMHLSGGDRRGAGVSGDPARRIGERPGLQPL